MRACATIVGAGLPANTGEARAGHRDACFAGKPAATTITLGGQPPRQLSPAPPATLAPARSC
ncbi:hypothetical protein DV532_23625 [Pseudomonas sp. Leaf58]|nr:hypothetical protein DV532_23625 [Pseudomonas sp. Leaf58]